MMMMMHSSSLSSLSSSSFLLFFCLLLSLTASSSLFAFPTTEADTSVEVCVCVARYKRVENVMMFFDWNGFLDFFLSLFFPFFVEKKISLSLSLSRNKGGQEIIFTGLKKTTHKKKREEEEAFRRL
mgnify:CR=1 FL=1